MPRPGPSVTSGADLQPGSDSLFPSGFTGGGARPAAGSVGTGELADGSVAAADLNLSSVATALSARSEFSGTYAPNNGRSTAGAQFLYNADHLRRWWAKLGDNAFTQATIGCFGDSVTAGAYANDVASTTDWALWRSRGWVGQLRTAVETRYGAVGELLNATDGIGSTNPFLTLSGAFTGSPAAAGINSSRLVFTVGTQTATFTLPACTTIEVFYYWRTSVLPSAALRYTLDGGSLTTAPTQSEVDGGTYSFTITGLANTTHTLVLQGPASNNAEVIAVGCWTNTSTGVRVDRRAKSGARFDTAFAIADPTSSLTSGDRTRQFNSVSSGLRTDLAIIDLSANQPTDTTHNPNPTTFAASVQAVVDSFVAKGSAVLLVGGPSVNPAGSLQGSGPYYQADYDAVFATIAAATDHVAYLDLKQAIGSWSKANALGYYVDTIVHPKRIGHGAIAALMYDVVTRPW